MRNLKKTLCLVLALVFVLGLCTIGAANDISMFDDAKSIQYVTQVKAMTGLGILVGYPDGSFKPAQNVTRAEAAKIISYIMVGTSEIEKWPAKEVFSDVPADHWAARYITFCQSKGIIVGDGNGKFRPNDNVKKSELAKMLLAACGYGLKDEFIGEGWDQNAARYAFECKVLKDIKTTDDWNSPASREETALMCYNTMFRTYRVVLGDDVDDYVPAWINGRYDVTFAESPWGLEDWTGIVYENKANMKNAKGTKIVSGGASIVVETEFDSDKGILGHEVTVLYRVEGVAPYTKNVAYFLDDECREVSGADANYKELANYAVTVDKGFVYSRFDAVRTKGLRYNDYVYKYILNADDVIVGCKYPDGFTIVPVSVNPYTYVAKVRPVGAASDEEVVLPEGVKNGDLVCLYQCGEIFTVLPTTKVENVAITQKQMNAGNNIQYWTYNDGAVVPTTADNITMINLASLTCMNPQEIMVLSTDTSLGIKRYEPVLKVGYSYTLYFDAEGGCFAYGDERLTTEVEIPYVMFVCDFVGHDAWHIEQNYAQIMKIDGTIEKVLLTAPAGLTRGDIVRVVPLGYKSTLVPADSTVALNRVTYPSGDPQYDYANAKYCWYGWYDATNILNPWNSFDENDQAQVEANRADLIYRGAIAKPDKGAEVSMVYKVVKIGTTYVRIVSGVWFMDASYMDPYGTDSFIYIVNDDIYMQRLIGGRTINFYYGYKDSVSMDDLRITPDSIADPQIGKYIGFNVYYKTANDEYVLQPVAEGNGLVSGARNIYLVDADTAPKDIPSNNYCFFLNGKLWVMDEYGVRHDIDPTDVKFVRLAGFSLADRLAGYKFPFTMPLDSVAAIQQLLLSKMKDEAGTTYTFRLNVAFVEKISPFGVHSIGGKTVYITGIEVATTTEYSPIA